MCMSPPLECPLVLQEDATSSALPYEAWPKLQPAGPMQGARPPGGIRSPRGSCPVMEAVVLCQGHDQQGRQGLMLDVHLSGIDSGGGLVTQSCLTLVTPWTVARQAPLPMGFSRQEYRSGLPCPPPGDLPDPGMEPGSPATQVESLPSEPPGKPFLYLYKKAKTYKRDISTK